MVSRPVVYAALAAGILIVSTAAILIRIAQLEGAPSLTIAALRLAIASTILVPIAWARTRHQWQAITGRDASLALASGTCLAVHFGAWITSLEHTSVASSTALVTTNPIWVGIGSVLFLHERLSRGMIIGIGLAVLGSLVMFFSDARLSEATGSNTLLGNGLALAGALSASAYLILGRMLRARLSLLAYISMAYCVAAILLMGVALAKGQALTGYSSTAMLCIVGLALGPQLLGHTILNWSVRQVPATLVALSILGEPIGSSLLAMVLLGESVNSAQGIGFFLILFGIFLAVRNGDDSRTKSGAKELS